VRALVTGCAGFIGSHLTESLLGEGASVVGVDCFNDNYGRKEKLRNLERAMDWEGFDFVPIDLARGDLFDLIDESDAVFHLAAEPGVRPSWGGRFEQYLRNNVQATQHLLEAARRRPQNLFLYASSSSVYGQAEAFPTPETVLPRPFSPYGLTKLSGEHLCDLYHGNYGVRTVTLRLFSVYGPRQRPDMAFSRFSRAALLDQPIEVYGDGNQTRDFTFVGDVVTAIRLAAEAPGAEGQIFNVGGGSQVSLKGAIELLEEVAGRKLELISRESQRGDVRDTCAETARIEGALGFVPSTDLRTGLERELEWMREALASPTPSAR
jgi:UDP-glucuronate 4-epimerase